MSLAISVLIPVIRVVRVYSHMCVLGCADVDYSMVAMATHVPLQAMTGNKHARSIWEANVPTCCKPPGPNDTL